jgi:hypothetical protein
MSRLKNFFATYECYRVLHGWTVFNALKRALKVNV